MLTTGSDQTLRTFDLWCRTDIPAASRSRCEALRFPLVKDVCQRRRRGMGTDIVRETRLTIALLGARAADDRSAWNGGWCLGLNLSDQLAILRGSAS